MVNGLIQGDNRPKNRVRLREGTDNQTRVLLKNPPKALDTVVKAIGG